MVHELVHLLERHHSDRFKKMMDSFMPSWRLHRDELSRAPLAHENWSYYALSLSGKDYRALIQPAAV